MLRPMVWFAAEVWLVLGIVTAAGAASVLYTLAKYFQHDRDLHDLRVRVIEVRRAYAQRIAAIAAGERGEVIEVSPVDDPPAEGPVGTIGSEAAAASKAA